MLVLNRRQWLQHAASGSSRLLRLLHCCTPAAALLLLLSPVDGLLTFELRNARLAGFESNGMVLCASSEDRSSVAFVEPPEAAEPGERVLMDGVAPVEPARGNAVKKKKLMEKAADELRAIDGVAHAHGKPLVAAGGRCTSPAVATGTIN